MKLRHKNPLEHKRILANLRKNPSNQQLYVLNYLKHKLKEPITCNDWTILNNLMEVDIVIPKLKIAIEWDGYYWHNKIRDADDKYKRKNTLLVNDGWRFIRVNDNKLSKKEIKQRYEIILNIIEIYKNSDDYTYTAGFYI